MTIRCISPNDNLMRIIFEENVNYKKLLKLKMSGHIKVKVMCLIVSKILSLCEKS